MKEPTIEEILSDFANIDLLELKKSLEDKVRETNKTIESIDKLLELINKKK